jgi:transcription initiation factor TFIID subunit TAF12
VDHHRPQSQANAGKIPAAKNINAHAAAQANINLRTKNRTNMLAKLQNHRNDNFATGRRFTL